MTRQAALVVILVNALVSAGLIAGYATFIAAPRAPRFAVLDVAELYRVKERELTSVLMKPDAREEERRQALERAHAFGTDLAALIERLPAECRCLILARGALIGAASRLLDLTPLVRQRMGLSTP